MGTIKINGKDLIGKKINEWTVLDVVSTDKLLCRCSCGKVKEVYKTHLVNDKSFSCGCRRRGYDKDPLIGKQFGEWTVIEKAREARMYTCKCSCGTVKDIIKDPPIDFNPDDFKDRETYERDTAVFMEGFNAALELIHDILADELPIEGEQDFTS